MPKVLLGDVARERKETCKGNKAGYPIVGLEHLVPEEITLTAWSEDSENTFSKMFHKGDVLFGRRRAYLKKAAVAPFDGICSGDITVIEANAERIVPELLPFIIQNDALFDFAVGKSAGSLSPRVKWEHLKNYEFELPEMDKQRELAEVLWAMDATKKSYQELITATDELVKSQFMEQFSCERAEIDGWKKRTFGQVCSLVNGRAFKPKDWTKDGTRIIRIQNLNDPNAEYNYYDKDVEDKYIVYDGDLLFAWSGTPGTSFGAFIWNRGQAILNQHIFNVYPDECIEKTFLKCSFEGHLDEIIEKAHGGVGLRHITKKELEAIELMVPPKEVQRAFVAFAEQSDKSKFELERALSELTATYKSIISENLG